jgi:hypothetical protein
MVLTVPFRRWLEAGCPDEYDYDGMLMDADHILATEYDAISEGGLTVLDGSQCAKLGLPPGSTNVDAIRELRKRWPIDVPKPPGAA